MLCLLGRDEKVSHSAVSTANIAILMSSRAAQLNAGMYLYQLGLYRVKLKPINCVLVMKIPFESPYSCIE